MAAVLAAATKAATSQAAKTTAKSAATKAASSTLRSGGSRAAAKAAGSRAAAKSHLKAAAPVAAESGQRLIIQQATKEGDNVIAGAVETLTSALAHSLMTAAAIGITGVGLSMVMVDKVQDSGLGFGPWLMGAMGLNMPGFGLSLPGLPDFGFGGGGDSAQGQAISDAAMKYVGQQFKPGVSAQCAVFVRAVLADAGVSVGVTQAPIDGKSTGPAFANSFYGNDLGNIIKDKGSLQPGDIVMFFNTYGNWPAGTVTHVGIYVGGGMMVDRPTASAPVKHRSIDTFEFAGALRLPGSESSGSSGGNAQIDALRRAIIGKESGGDFKAVNPDSGALGYGQLMPSNVGPWTAAALGRSMSPQEFLNNPDDQIATINHKLGEYLNQQLAAGYPEDIAIRRVAAMWYSGQADLYNDTKPQPYGGAVYESIQSYTTGVLSKYKSYR